VSPEEIAARVKELADQIVEDYLSNPNPILMICILKGAMPFFVDLARAIGDRLQIEEDCMILASYHGGTASSGAVKIVTDLRTSISNRDIIIVEDIVDSGHTLSALLNLLRTRTPNSIRVCALLNKRVRERDVHVPIHYQGFEIPEEFVVGYGLDYQEGFRHLPFIGVLKPEVYRR